MLGNLLQSFGVNNRELLARVVVGVAIIGLSLYMMTNFFWYDFRLDFLTIAGTIMFSLFSLGGFWLISTVLETLWRMPRVDIHENGVKLLSRGREQSWLWQDIRYIEGSVTQIALVTMIGDFRFCGDQADLFRLDNRVANLSQVCGLIAAQVNNLLLPEYRQRLEQGETVEFGEIELSKQMVTKGKQQVALREIAGCSLAANVLSLQSHSQQRLMWSMLEHVVNPLLLMELLHELTTSEFEAN